MTTDTFVELDKQIYQISAAAEKNLVRETEIVWSRTKGFSTSHALKQYAFLFFFIFFGVKLSAEKEVVPNNKPRLICVRRL